MPLYDYQCKQCQQVAEVRHGFTDVHTAACTQCGGPMMRVFNPAGIVFKGSGFYITDSRKAGSGETAPAAPSTAAAATASTPAAAPASETKKSETKKSDAA